jgi:hypothetical protein
MGAYLQSIQQSADDIPDLVIKRITDHAGLAVWMDIWMHFDDGKREPRGRGIGTAITLAPLRDAHAFGYEVVVLAPSRESHRMYQRIGFDLFPSESCYFTL